MRSVADDLRDEERARLAALTPAERVALALGVRDLALFRQVHDPPLAEVEAARRLESHRQTSRRPSGCLAALIGSDRRDARLASWPAPPVPG